MYLFNSHNISSQSTFGKSSGGYSNAFAILTPLSYNPLLSNNSSWIATAHGFEGYITTKYAIVGDTTFNGVNYKKIKGTDIKMPTLSSDPQATGNQDIQLLREDVTRKRVFKLNSTGVETLIYDFGTYSLDISNIQSGSYIVSIKSNSGVSVHKIQKM